MGWVVAEPAHVLGEPKMGGREGGVKRPEEREWRRGEERGETLQCCCWCCGETVQLLLGGELPQAEPLEPLEVRRRWGTGGVPMEN
jgi:hypothetical protein